MTSAAPARPLTTFEHAVLHAHATSPEFLEEMPVLGKAGSKKRAERLLEGSTEFCLDFPVGDQERTLYGYWLAAGKRRGALLSTLTQFRLFEMSLSCVSVVLVCQLGGLGALVVRFPSPPYTPRPPLKGGWVIKKERRSPPTRNRPFPLRHSCPP